MVDPRSLRFVFDGWDGYNIALVKAIGPRTAEELAWRGGRDLRSVGEVASHIALGRLDWFKRMPAPGWGELEQKLSQLIDAETRAPLPEVVADARMLVRMLNDSWQMVQATLDAWTVDDLTESFLQPYQGKTYSVSRQWVIFRILAHDIHHGGQISEMLFQQGIEIVELGYLGGHLTEPPVA